MTMTDQPPRSMYCLKIDPRQTVELLVNLSRLGTVTADRAASVLWLDAPGLPEDRLEQLPGVLKAIEFDQPLWSDVLNRY